MHGLLIEEVGLYQSTKGRVKGASYYITGFFQLFRRLETQADYRDARGAKSPYGVSCLLDGLVKG